MAHFVHCRVRDPVFDDQSDPLHLEMMSKASAKPQEGADARPKPVN
jgi:hypothetical protein